MLSSMAQADVSWVFHQDSSLKARHLHSEPTLARPDRQCKARPPETSSQRESGLSLIHNWSQTQCEARTQAIGQRRNPEAPANDQGCDQDEHGTDAQR